MSKLIEQLKHHEGLRLKPYKCTAGKWTIGYGRNLDDRGITKYEAELMLAHDVAEIREKLRSAFCFWRLLDEPRKAVLVNMAFNIGVHGLLKFKKTLALIEARDYSAASLEMLDSNWAAQVPNRAGDLSIQMENGVFS